MKHLFVLAVLVGSVLSLNVSGDIGDIAAPSAQVTETECANMAGYTITNLTRGSSAPLALMNEARGCPGGTLKVRTTFNGGRGPRYYCATCKGRLCSRPNTNDGADRGLACAVPPSNAQFQGGGGGGAGMLQIP